MTTFPLLVLSLLALAVHATPLGLEKRDDDCLDVNGASPGPSYYGGFSPIASCSPKYKLDADRTCTSSISVDSNDCNAFCETKRFWFYGKPQSLMGGDMCYPGGCDITQSTAFTVTKTWTIQTSFKASQELASKLTLAFDVGASFSKAEATMTGKSNTRERADKTTCGTWMTVPIWQASCGVVSSQEKKQVPTMTLSGFYRWDWACTGDVQTTHKVCDVAVMKDKNGNPMSQTVFATQNCDSRAFTGPETQEAPFNQAVDWQEYYDYQVAGSEEID